MPHVAYVALSGLRVRENELLALGMSLPGLRQRAATLAALPSLGLLTLAALTPPHWTCSYHELSGNGEGLEDEILATRPKVVALSALTAAAEEAYRLSARLRRAEVRVVLGGLHATAIPEEAVRHADAVVCGEGEPLWPRVLADAEIGELRPLYRPDAPFDLARSPVPRFDLLGTQRRARFTLQTQRGCPLACEFCAASRLLGPFREKPVSNLRAELAALGQLDPRPVIELADDNTYAGSRPPEELFEALAAANVRYFTEVDWRIGERPEILGGLAASGCVQVLVGLESLVFRYPGMGPKQAELARCLDALQAVQERGVAVIGCFIVGGDGETRASLDRLAQFLLDCPLADVQLTLQTPFPGTALRRRLERQGRLLPDRGWANYTLFDLTYQPDRMDVAELETAFRDLLRLVFSPAATARRQAIRRRIGNVRLRPCRPESFFAI